MNMRIITQQQKMNEVLLDMYIKASSKLPRTKQNDDVAFACLKQLQLNQIRSQRYKGE